jgi:hypothetical protein
MPDTIRTNVNVAASIAVCFNACRQRSELLANANIARAVRTKTLLVITSVEQAIRAERRQAIKERRFAIAAERNRRLQIAAP